MKRSILVFSAIILFGTCTVIHADPPGWKIIQLTDNTTVDQNPRISGSNIVWEGEGLGSESEIFFWDGSTITQITDNEITDTAQQISGSNIVWQSGVGIDSEIYFWNGVSTTRITNNDTWDTMPQISGSNVCWRGEDGDGVMQVYFWNGSTTRKITHNGATNPQISGSTIVWEGVWDPDTTIDVDVLSWSGSDIVNISDAYGHDERPKISDGNMAWLGYDSSYKRQIHLLIGSGKYVSDNNYQAQDHQLSGSNVAWWAYDGGNNEIFIWGSLPKTKISGDNGLDNRYPRISGSNVVWEAKDTSSDNDTDIFYWDPSSGVIRFTDNDYQDRFPQISGSIIVWHGMNSLGTSLELFVATKCTSPTKDLSGDCKVDNVDVALLANDWLGTYVFADLVEMASQWLTCGYDIQPACWP